MDILIYGHRTDEEIVFLPEAEARYWAEFDDDCKTGIPYGTLHEKYPSIFERIIENKCGYLGLNINLPNRKHLNAEEYFNWLFESLYEEYGEEWIDRDEGCYDLNSESGVRRFYEEELLDDERFPLIDEIFSTKTMGYWDMFEWADELPKMEGWVPKEIEKKFAKIIDYGTNMAASVTSNSDETIRLEYRIEDEKELIKAFEKHGYKCIRNDELIQKACG